AGVAAHADVTHADTPQQAAAIAAAAAGADSTPVFAVLAADRPGRFTMADALLLSRAWPLMPIVSVASSLVDGRRRSGPALPGIEEVPWHDLPSRSAWWLAAIAAGLPTRLGLPATSRREERLLESIGGMRGRSGEPPRLLWPGIELSVAASHADDLDGLCDLLVLAGHAVETRQAGRPRLDEQADVLVWDVRDLTARDLEWLRLLAANRPGLFILVLDSFPRGDTVAAAMRAGAAVVLGRPVCLEAVCGALLSRRTENAGQIGLGRAGRRR
ncbi:MAG: hypothetical protein ACKOWG_17215, partial [Planctomycetia bacterium]